MNSKARVIGAFYLLTILAAVALLDALMMIGWLLVAGVNEQRWREQAAA